MYDIKGFSGLIHKEEPVGSKSWSQPFRGPSPGASHLWVYKMALPRISSEPEKWDTILYTLSMFVGNDKFDHSGLVPIFKTKIFKTNLWFSLVSSDLYTDIILKQLHK